MSSPGNDNPKKAYPRDGRRGHRPNREYRGGGHGYRGRPFKRQIHDNYVSNGKRTRCDVGERLKEEDIGVTEFVGKHKRLAGILKERYSDFYVHEISCDGQICKLTNQDLPPEPQDLVDMDELKESLPSDVRTKLENFTESDKDNAVVEIDVTEMDKELRRNIHTIAKKIPSVVSETVERDGKKIIVLAKKTKKMSHKFRGDRREDWSSREGNYCQFLLHKINMDTMDALNQLAVKLRIKANLFQYAGTKDRRAHTTQSVSLRKVSPTSILRAARQVHGAQVGNFTFTKDPLKLGMLNGNRFTIALRSIDASDDEIDRAMESLRDNGFINYYGLQRFGTIVAIPTHEIGKALLQGKWKRAIELILKPRSGEQNRDIIEARDIYQKTKNAVLALQPIARSGKIEANLLQGIVSSGENNPQGALDYLPRNARLMYIHSYQSLVWNRIVSKRIKELGSKPIVGDLVYEKSDSKESETLEYELTDEQKQPEAPKSNDAEEKKDCVDPQEKEVKNDEPAVESEDIDKEIPLRQIADVTISADENNDNKKKMVENDTLDDSKDESSLPAVVALKEEDLMNYTLADVVMPKPGWKVTYPSYAKPWFDELLAKDDLTTDLRQNNKKYSLGGAYRKILETPGDVSWKVVRYSGYHDDLIHCDIDKMRGSAPLKLDDDGENRALVLEFSLRSSTYATMALREILKDDTSAHTQATQSAANQAQNKLDKAEVNKTTGSSNIENPEPVLDKQVEKIAASENDENCAAEPEVAEETNDVASPEKITRESNESKMEVVKDEGDISKD